MKKFHLTKKLFIGSIFFCFVVTTNYIFDQIYLTSKVVIDEAFHLPQGLQYCNFNFTTWDPKITTLPGLYLISAIIFGPLNICTIYTLRFTNLIAATVNLVLLYVLLGLYDSRISTNKKLLISINLSLLPPLYFFSNLYYTDVISLTFTLLLIIFNKKEQHVLSSICGLMAIIVRQTNIIWVLMVFGEYGIREMFIIIKNSNKHNVDVHDLMELLKNPRVLYRIKCIPYKTCLHLTSYVIVFLTFASFVYFNGGIVVGDKAAHVATIHIPQIFYFSLFYLIFTWSSSVNYVKPFLNHVKCNKTFSLISVILMLAFIYGNTQVHPYLLADNRHYTFYIWTRFYGKYFWFKYGMVFVYYFAMYVIFKKLYVKNDIIFPLLYILCVILILIPQRLIEIRYFLIPYVLLRLKSVKDTYSVLIIELTYFIFINVITLRLFFKKDIYWTDFDYPQKIIW